MTWMLGSAQADKEFGVLCALCIGAALTVGVTWLIVRDWLADRRRRHCPPPKIKRDGK
jgi:hypothetical protein